VRDWLVLVTEQAVVVIDAMATLIILFGTIEAFVDGLRVFFSSKSSHEKRDVWLRYARWLIAGLTFQLASDIIETSIRTNWESIAQLGAIAVIRTFLNYFLEKDLDEVREEQRGPARGKPAESPK
jgi:uncharacterized membrane protein